MAELDFKHHVSEIPRGEKLPEPIPRKVGMEVSRIPDFQGPLSNYGSATNWMSDLGSKVASAASNEIATRLGGELGKNPQGELGPSITDFDKQLSASYATQAQATLGIEAQKLITKSNLELAEQPRINQDMISKTQKSTLMGLDKIFSLAPSSIRPQLEHQYSSIMIHQNEQLVNRMMKEQKEDRLANLELSSNLAAENAHSLAMSGDEKGALSHLQSTISATRSAANTNDITILQAKNIQDTVRLSLLSGKYTRLALQADREKRLPEYLESLANNQPDDLSDKDYPAVVNNIMQYMNQQQSLKSQSEQLAIAKFNVRLAEDPNSITGTEFANLQSQLTPIQAQKVKLNLIQALNKKTKDESESFDLIKGWGDSRIQARAGEALKNKTFDKLVQKTIDDSNGSISLDNAEVQVAASAGSSIGVFIDTIHNKFSSGNPISMESAAQQVHSLYEMGAGHALDKLSDQDKVMFSTIESLRNSLDPTEAMREAVNKIYNQGSNFKVNQDLWNHYISTQTRSIPKTTFALSKFGYDRDDFLNPSLANDAATDFLDKFGTYFQLSGGDEKVAKSVAQRYIDENYGKTSINGGSHATLHPLEKILGYKSNDVTTIIQQDIVDTVNSNFAESKIAFNLGQSNEYWESLPVRERKRGEYLFENEPIKVKRYTKTNKGLKAEEFEIVVQGNSFDKWDIGVYSKNSGLRPLSLAAPYLGVITYIPNKEKIDAEYLRRNS